MGGRIQGYRRIWNWENFFLDSAICSIGHSVGVKFEDGFQPIAAATGDAFAYMYSDEKPCDSGMTNYIFRPEAVERAYALFGYGCVYLSQTEIQEAMEAAKALIRASVDRGVPVLLWGCGGVVMRSGKRYDPLPEGALIGGYDDADLLYVNLYPGEERLAETSACGKPGVDADGYTAIFAKDALATTKGMFVLGPKLENTDPGDICRRILFSIPEHLKMPAQDGYVFGRQAFAKWAAVLLDDANWQDNAEENLWNKHCCAYCALCTSIGVGEGEGIIRTIRMIAERLPEVPEARSVLPLFEKLRALNQSIWNVQGGFMPPVERMKERDLRESLAEILQAMGAVCDDIAAVF